MQRKSLQRSSKFLCWNKQYRYIFIRCKNTAAMAFPNYFSCMFVIVYWYKPDLIVSCRWAQLTKKLASLSAILTVKNLASLTLIRYSANQL